MLYLCAFTQNDSSSSAGVEIVTSEMSIHEVDMLTSPLLADHPQRLPAGRRRKLLLEGPGVTQMMLSHK